MNISPHLCFDGQCRAAFATYQQILGGTIQTMLTYGESPMSAQVACQWHDRIVHASLQFGDIELAGVDLLPSEYRKPQGFSVLLSIEGTARASQVLALLADGGEIRLPFQPTFWSPGFGVVVDRFAIPWEVSSFEPAISANPDASNPALATHFQSDRPRRGDADRGRSSSQETKNLWEL